MNETLIGGGWNPETAPELYGGFLAAAADRAERAARRRPSLAVVVIDEGQGAELAQRWTSVLRGLADVDTRHVLVPLGGVLRLADVAGSDGLLVAGGLTPAYAAALRPTAGALRAWVTGGLPYAGHSAGAAVAPSRALVGGWRVDGAPVCPAEAGEDLDEVTVVDGLGLLPETLDVHAAQWGTLPRLAAMLRRDGMPMGYAIDEDTAISITEAGDQVLGSGAVHRVTPDGTVPLYRGCRL